MKQYKKSTKGEKNNAASNNVVQNNTIPPLLLIDNRPEAVAQRKMQELTANRTKTAQLFPQSRTISVIQRNPVKDQEGENYHDSDYPGVKMKRLEGGYPYKYQILNLGQYLNTIVVDDDGEYYIPDETGEPDYDQPFNLQNILMEDPVASADTSYINIGQPGSGVLAGSGGPVTLRTSGLNSCVAWLLYNARAGYMEHILVGDPTKVKRDGIRAQIAQIQAKFTEAVGAAATNFHLHVDESHPAYKNSWPIWFKELIPNGLTVGTSMGSGDFSHQIPLSESGRVLWRCDKISLQYEE